MKVLFLTYHYPPDPAVGAIRAANAVAALQSRGHQVEVIAAQHELAGAAPNIHRVHPHANISAAFRRTRRRPRATDSAAAPPKVPGKPMPYWKRIALSLLLLPDENQGYVWPATRLARRIARQGFDVIFTTAPPHSVTVAGLLLRTYTRIPWVAELRDPWTDNAIRPPYHTRLRVAASSWLERACLRHAQAIIPVTESTGELLRERVRDPEKILVVRNGIPGADPVAGRWPATSDEPFRLVHGGTLYGRRDPRPLIAAIAALRKSGAPDLPAAIHLEFVGDCAWYEPLIMEAARELADGDRVILHGRQSRARSAGMLASADLLLLLAQDQPLQVPQKLYDYLAAKRPILAFVDRAGESARMLDAAGGHHAVHGSEQEEIRTVLMRALAAARTPFHTDERLLREWSVENQMARLVDAVEAVAGLRRTVLS